MTKERERKKSPHYLKSIDGRATTGIYSVYGNVDSYQDVAMPGSFAKTLAERSDEIFHLWQHDFNSPAIAVIKDLRELRQDELPDVIKMKYPQALGGAQVTREYLDTPRGNEILEGHVKGVPYQMSFAFDAVKFDFGEQDDTRVRYLREMRLYETSDVLWGANDATVASKMPLDLLLANLDGYLKTNPKALPVAQLLKYLDAHLIDLKAGARHSTADTKAINDIHNAVVNLGATTCKGIVDDTDKAAELESRAEPVSLTLAKARLFLLDFAS